MLEAARGDDLEDPAGLVAGIPERVPLVARLERKVPHLCMDNLFTELGAHPPLEHEAVLVLTRVLVERCRQGPGRHRMLDQREATAGLLGPGHHAGADRPQVDCLAAVGSDDPWPLRGLESAQVAGLRCRVHGPPAVDLNRFVAKRAKAGRPGHAKAMGVTGLEPVTSALSRRRSPN